MIREKNKKPQQKWIVTGVVGLFLALLVIMSVILRGPRNLFDVSSSTSATDLKNALAIDWKLLYKLDYKTGDAPEEVKSLHNKAVRIPGFVVPLSDNMNQVDEFLLVPDAMSCIHVPPPPPNLIVQVKLDKAIPSSELPNPAWITGVLFIEKTQSAYGSASYRMEGKKIERYEAP